MDMIIIIAAAATAVVVLTEIDSLGTHDRSVLSQPDSCKASTPIQKEYGLETLTCGLEQKPTAAQIKLLQRFIYSNTSRI